MNFLSVKVIDDGNSITLDEGSFKIKADASHLEFLKKYIGKEVFFGIRPEDMVFAENANAENSMQVKVTVVEPLGADIHLWLTTEKGQPLVARTEPNKTFKVGDSTIFTPKMEKARYFDKDTELAIVPAPKA
jgi:multiple sugar transport system ATP-binding protein